MIDAFIFRCCLENARLKINYFRMIEWKTETKKKNVKFHSFDAVIVAFEKKTAIGYTIISIKLNQYQMVNFQSIRLYFFL